MANTNYPSVDAYLAAQPKTSLPTLKRLRETLRKALPGAEETISYQIPTYKLNGRMVIYFAGWKEHCAVYPANGGVAEAFRDELEGLVVSKGTIRFPYSDPLPVKLIARIAKFRAKAALEATASKKAAKPKPSPRRKT